MTRSNLSCFCIENKFLLAFISMLIWLASWGNPSLLLGEELPYLIELQPGQVQESWHKVNQLIKENASLEKPLPDPYLARAELWTLVGNHEEAIEDYLEATNLTLDGNPTVADQTRMLLHLKESLKRLAGQPQPRYPQKSREFFQVGFRLFYKGMYEEAAPLLAEATRLNTSDAVYRVVRALNCKKLGQHTKASQQLSAASSILKHPYFSKYELMDFHTRLERIQYSDRRWISEGLLNAGLSDQSTRKKANRLVSQIEITVKSN
tara:strand:- start:9790 stop:10581 length:792 start_codon:yes stop_codon:yes gene_type:complete